MVASFGTQCASYVTETGRQGRDYNYPLHKRKFMLNGKNMLSTISISLVTFSVRFSSYLRPKYCHSYCSEKASLNPAEAGEH